MQACPVDRAKYGDEQTTLSGHGEADADVRVASQAGLRLLDESHGQGRMANDRFGDRLHQQLVNPWAHAPRNRCLSVLLRKHVGGVDVALQLVLRNQLTGRHAPCDRAARSAEGFDVTVPTRPAGCLGTWHTVPARGDWGDRGGELRGRRPDAAQSGAPAWAGANNLAQGEAEILSCSTGDRCDPLTDRGHIRGELRA